MDCHKIKLLLNGCQKYLGFNLFKKTIVYALSSILSAAIPFALLPILTRYLTPAEYGQIAMFSIFTTALSSLIGLSVHGAANRRFFDEDVTDTNLASFNGNCFFILLFTTCFALLPLFFFDVYLSNYLGIPPIWIYFGVLNVFCSFILNLRLGQWQVRGKAISYGALQITNSFFVLLLNLLFVILLKLGPDGSIYGIVLTSVIVGLISFFTLRNDKLVNFKYNREDINYALSFGVPLIPHVLGGFLLLSVDRLIINKELGLEMTGIYMVAMNLGSALNIIFNSINKAYSPWLFANLKENILDVKIKVVKNTYLYFTFLIIAAVLAYFTAPQVLKLLAGERFHQAADVLPIIIIGQIFLGMYFMVTNYIFYIRKTKYLSYITISSGMINVFFLLVLIPCYGIHGAALAFLIANFNQFIVTWIVSATVYKMPWLLWKF